MLSVYMNTINNSRQSEDAPLHQQDYTVFGKISATPYLIYFGPDSSATIAMAMLFDEPNKLAH